MRSENDLSRRTLLAVVGTATTGSAITTTATAQERDPTEYDRPLTIEKNGIETTFHDCSRVVIDSSQHSAANRIIIGASWITPNDWVQSEQVDIANPEFPFEYVVNCHRHEIGVDHGAATISGVNVWFGSNSHVYFEMPFFEWDCGEVRGQEVDPRVFEEHC